MFGFDEGRSRKALRTQEIIKRDVFNFLSTTFRLFRGGQFLLAEEAGVPRENHRPLIRKLTFLVN